MKHRLATDSDLARSLSIDFRSSLAQKVKPAGCSFQMLRADYLELPAAAGFKALGREIRKQLVAAASEATKHWVFSGDKFYDQNVVGQLVGKINYFIQR